MKYSNIDFNNKTILITGGAGFIGSNLAHYFNTHYPKANVVVIDKFKSPTSLGAFENLIGFKGTVLALDITDDLSLLDDYCFDYIFHQAAISDTTANDEYLMMQTNVNAFVALLHRALKSNAKVVYASSGATYGNAQAPQTVGKEMPQNIYGFSKLMMDNAARAFVDKNPTMHVVGLRYFNVYGQNELAKGSTASMVLQFGLQLLNNQEPKLFEKSDEIYRDFVYIDDIVQANIKALSSVSGVYNVGSGKARTFQDIVDILQQELHTNLTCTYIPNPYIGRYQFFTQADISTTKQALDYEPNFSLEKGIKAYIPTIKRIAAQNNE